MKYEVVDKERVYTLTLTLTAAEAREYKQALTEARVPDDSDANLHLFTLGQVMQAVIREDEDR